MEWEEEAYGDIFIRELSNGDETLMFVAWLSKDKADAFREQVVNPIKNGAQVLLWSGVPIMREIASLMFGTILIRERGGKGIGGYDGVEIRMG
jgi:hypothetical protein